MKKRIPILILLVWMIPGLQSCHFNRNLAKLLGQWKTPTWKTTDEIEDFAEKDDAVYDAFYYVDNFRDWAHLSQKGLVNFPGIYLYDQNLRPVQVFIGSDCPTKAMDYIDHLNGTSENVLRDTTLAPLDDFLKHTAFLKGENDFLNLKNPDYDYVFVYTWVTFVPQKAQEVYHTARELMQKKKLTFKIIGINEDFMAEWGEDPTALKGEKVDLDNLSGYRFKL